MSKLSTLTVLIGCALVLAFVPGCGDDDVTPGTDAGPGGSDAGPGGGDAGPGGGDAGPGGTDAGPGGGDAGPGGDDGGAGGPTCAAYCALIQANCTGANMQYATTDACMAACATMTPGTTGMTSGNTVGCRTYHAGAAAADPGTHCDHAGATGGGVCM